MVYSRVDLFVAVNSKMIENQILEGVKKLINKISAGPEQTLIVIKNYIKSLKSKWIIGTNGINLELIPDNENDPASNIVESLRLLENFLSKKKTQAVFFIDEFQEVGNLKPNGIEGGIRSVAQETEYLSFIFSGSNRYILSTMFDDRSRPLFMLCDRLSIDRIPENDYRKYLDKVSKKTWGHVLSHSLIDEIFNCTERHPYYFNALCDKLWNNFENKPPTLQDIIHTWNEYAIQEESKIARELSNLSTVQKKLLIAIAGGTTKDLSGKAQLRKINVTSASIVKALRQLEAKDYLGKNKDGEYYIIDPLIKYSLNIFYP